MITAAAVKGKDGTIYTGLRYSDILCDRTKPFGYLRDGTQGFVTTKGDFVDRKVALAIAIANNQLKGEKNYPKNQLMSEDLW